MQLLFTFSVIFFSDVVMSTEVVKVEVKQICFGESTQLKCSNGEQLNIYDAFYQVVESNSSYCNLTKTTTSCPVPQLVSSIRAECDGKDRCDVTNVKSNKKLLCRSIMYLKIRYTCGSPSLMTFTAEPVQNIGVTQSKLSTTEVANVFKVNTKEKLVLQLLFTFLDTRLVFIHLKNNPKQLILCITLSMAAGLLVLVLYGVLLFCCLKCKTRQQSKTQFDIEDGEHALEVSSPVLQTSVPVAYETVVLASPNGVVSTQTTTTLTRNNNVNKRPKTKEMKSHELISTLRRSHSIDEGTQTDNEECEPCNNDQAPSGSLSQEEVQELGYLVDVMKYYNSRLDDDVYPELRESKKENEATEIDDAKFFFSSETKGILSPIKHPRLKKQISFNSTTSTNRYLDDQELSSSEEKFKTSPRHTEKFPSESPNRTNISLTSNELDFFSPESIFNGDTLKFKSIPRTPKLGVRGDGFDVIMGEPSSSTK